MQTRVFPAQLSELDSILTYLREQIKATGMAIKSVKQFEVALEEAIVNVIHYAYDDPSGMIELISGVNSDDETFQVVLKDHGRPFNPLDHTSPNVPPKDLETQKIGGLGIYIIKKMVDVVFYEYVEGCNILSLSKKINSQTD